MGSLRLSVGQDSTPYTLGVDTAAKHQAKTKTNVVVRTYGSTYPTPI
eukprot:SAG25_NODE_11757_length_296_cov_0.781726_1_plen_46_part_01